MFFWKKKMHVKQKTPESKDHGKKSPYLNKFSSDVMGRNTITILKAFPSHEIKYAGESSQREVISSLILRTLESTFT